METTARIRRDHLVRGVLTKKITGKLRISRNTARKVVRGDETPFNGACRIQPMPKLGPWVGTKRRHPLIGDVGSGGEQRFAPGERTNTI